MIAGRYTDEPPPMHPNTRSRICHYITGSALFKDVFKEERVYIYQMPTLMSHGMVEPSIFYSLYEASPNSEYEMIYVNRPRVMEVINTVLDDEDDENDEADYEYVFTCLTIDSSGALAVYHVSGEYNLSDTVDTYLPGRFIFYGYHDEEKTVTDMFAVAEVPGRSLSAPGEHVERLYLIKKGENEPGEFLHKSLLRPSSMPYEIGCSNSHVLF